MFKSKKKESSTILKIIKFYGIFSVLSLGFYIFLMFFGFSDSNLFLTLGIFLGIVCTCGVLGYFEEKDDLNGVLKLMIGISAFFTIALFFIVNFSDFWKNPIKESFWLCMGINMVFIASMFLFLGAVVWKIWIKDILHDRKLRRDRDFFKDLLNKYDGTLFQENYNKTSFEEDVMWKKIEELREDMRPIAPSEDFMLKKMRKIRMGEFVMRSDINRNFRFLGGDHKDINNWQDCGEIYMKKQGNHYKNSY